MKENKTEKKKRPSNVIKFGKNEIDVSKLSDEELTELYSKMANKKISLIKKIMELNKEDEVISNEELDQIMEML